MRARWCLAPLLAACLAAGCGSDANVDLDDPASDTTTTTTTTTEVTSATPSTTAPGPSDDDAGGGVGDEVRVQDSVAITVRDAD